MQHHVFLSYSHKDMGIMQQIRNDLSAAGLTVWTDEDIEPGTASWKGAIQKAIDSADCLVAVLSPLAKQSEWVAKELDYAEMQKKQIFPILAYGNESDAIPFGYAASQWVDLRDKGQSKTQFTKLINTINKKFIPNSNPNPNHQPQLDSSNQLQPLINLVGTWQQTFASEEIGMRGIGDYVFEASGRFNALVSNPIAQTQEIQEGLWHLDGKSLFLEGHTYLQSTPSRKMKFSTVIKITYAEPRKFIAEVTTVGIDVTGIFVKVE